MELTPENSDGSDCGEPLSQEESDALFERAPEYIKAGIIRRRAELAQWRRAKLRVALDFGVGPDELERIRGARPTTEAGIAALVVDEAELTALGRWGGQPEPPRWAPRSNEKPPKLITASELFDEQ